jgi:hypothetical protein
MKTVLALALLFVIATARGGKVEFVFTDGNSLAERLRLLNQSWIHAELMSAESKGYYFEYEIKRGHHTTVGEWPKQRLKFPPRTRRVHTRIS